MTVNWGESIQIICKYSPLSCSLASRQKGFFFVYCMWVVYHLQKVTSKKRSESKQGTTFRDVSVENCGTNGTSENVVLLKQSLCSKRKIPFVWLCVFVFVVQGPIRLEVL